MQLQTLNFRGFDAKVNLLSDTTKLATKLATKFEDNYHHRKKSHTNVGRASCYVVSSADASGMRPYPKPTQHRDEHITTTIQEITTATVVALRSMRGYSATKPDEKSSAEIKSLQRHFRQITRSIWTVTSISRSDHSPPPQQIAVEEEVPSGQHSDLHDHLDIRRAGQHPNRESTRPVGIATSDLY